jgi:CheY-like chemotaxis protein
MYDFSKISILIVDDEPDICELLSYDFEKLGTKVYVAHNGLDAFKIAMEQSIDAVISDIKMPGGNGITLLDELKKERKNLPVVLFISGHTDITLEDSYNKGAEALFTKPFDRKELVLAVAKSLFEQKTKWSVLNPDWAKTAIQVVCNYETCNLANSQNQSFAIGRGGFAICLEAIDLKKDQILNFSIGFTDNSLSQLQGYGIIRWVSYTASKVICGVELLYLEEPGRSHFKKEAEKLDPVCFIPKIIL